MQLKSDPHIFSGMQRDFSISKQKSESLYDAKNIRFTARDGDTMLSITNEKGTTSLNTKELVNNAWQNVVLQGNYIGHCVINNYVVLFTHKAADSMFAPDFIYKLTPVANSISVEVELLYNGDLKFDLEHPLETLGVYENKDIQKVYWVDSKNQPRMINVCKVLYSTAHQDQFDFVATLDLDETVSVSRKEGSGTFAPGTIQYAFTYYNKYGRQSNIFYTTLLYYISYQNRGASPEDKVSVCFEITVDNLQTDDFEYLRVYSIHRTSENAVPTVKRVIDIELATVNNESTTFVDDGEIGNTIDPTELLYIGGESTIAGALTQKDNTLFLGNLELNRLPIHSDLKDYLCTINKDTLQLKSSVPQLSWNEFLKSYNLNKYDSSNGYYNYISSLDWSSPGFKIREHYRLGIQFQHKTGKWSEPIFIGDYTMDGITVNNAVNTRINPEIVQDPLTNNYVLKEPCISLTFDLNQDVSQNWYDWLIENDYKKVRPVVVFPTIGDRLVLTQGLLCPTVYSKRDRKSGTPFAQSSWFLRPTIPDQYVDESNNSKYNTLGNWAEFRHMHQLGSQGSFNAEIQGSEQDDSKIFYVDQSIVTMHSPDIEWDDSFYSLDYTKWNLNIVGCVNFTSSVSDVDVQTSTPAFKSAKGFVKSTASVTNRSNEAGRSLLSALLWEDTLIGYDDDDDEHPYKGIEGIISTDSNNNNLDQTKTYSTKYLIYPWHRSGSLNNDENRESDKGTRTAVLKEKKLSNLKFSDFNTYFNNNYKYNISPIQLFSSDQVSLIKVPFTDNSTSLGNVSYYGNVDTLLNGNTNYYIENDNGTSITTRSITSDITVPFELPIIGGTVNITLGTGLLFEGAAPVRMKYKSGKHLIFSLTSNGNHNTVILPKLSNTQNYYTEEEQVGGTTVQHSGINKNKFFWLSQDEMTNNQPVIREIYAKVSNNPEYESDDVVASFVDANTIDALKQATINANPGYVLLLCTTNSTVYRIIGLDYLEDSNKWELQCSKEFDSLGRYYKYGSGAQAETYVGIDSQGKVESCVIDTPDTDYFLVNQTSINEDNDYYPYLMLGELYREDSPDLNAFNGVSDDAVKNNLWIPAGKSVPISQVITVEFTQGDTWFTRYDCLKTYPFTHDDENQIVEIGSFLCESRINGDGRYDRNRGQASNLNMSPINFNLFNPVYNNKDNFFNYRILDKDYYNLNEFTNQITWSKEKQAAADVDLWTNITMANTFDLDGTMGPINALRTWKDTIYCFQDNAISIISFNPRVQIPTSDGVPIEISNSYKLEGKVYISDSIGCKNKQTIAVTPSGVYFIDPNSKELYNLAGNQLTSVSASHGFSNWFKENELTHVFYDKNRNDLYVLNANDCIVYSEVLGQFTSFMDYNNTPAMFNIGNTFYAFRNNGASVTTDLYSMFTGKYNDFFGTTMPYWIEFISNQDSAIDKIFSTVDMRVDYRDYAQLGNPVLHNEFFDAIRVNNEYQDTGYVTLNPSMGALKTNAKKKFRVWRISIPRDRSKPLDRIRNTWTKLKFGKTPSQGSNIKMELHDLSVQYFI